MCLSQVLVAKRRPRKAELNYSLKLVSICSIFQCILFHDACAKARVMKVVKKKACKVKGDCTKGFFSKTVFGIPAAKKPLPTHGIADGKKIIQYALRLPKTAPLDLVCVWSSDM